MSSLKAGSRVIPKILKDLCAQKSAFVAHRCLTFQSRLLTPQSQIFNLQKRTFFKDASKDEIPEGRIRVYYGLLTPQIRAVKWFSLTTSVMGIVAQPFIYKELSHLDSVPLLIAGCSLMGFFTFVTPFLLHFITKKYITHLDYISEKNTYIASTVNFFCMLKETKFTPEEVHVPAVPGMFTTFVANGKPLFFEARLFDDPSHYSKIMGYDKPMDFKLYDTHDKKENN